MDPTSAQNETISAQPVPPSGFTRLQAFNLARMEREILIKALLALGVTPIFFEAESEELLLPRPLTELEQLILKVQGFAIASAEAPKPPPAPSVHVIEDAEWTPATPAPPRAPPEQPRTVLLTEPAKVEAPPPKPAASPEPVAPQQPTSWWKNLGAVAAGVGLGGLAVAAGALVARRFKIAQATAGELSRLHAELLDLRKTLAEVRRRTELPAGRTEDTAEDLRRADEELDVLFEQIDAEASRRGSSRDG